MEIVSMKPDQEEPDAPDFVYEYPALGINLKTILNIEIENFGPPDGVPQYWVAFHFYAGGMNLILSLDQMRLLKKSMERLTLDD